MPIQTQPSKQVQPGDPGRPDRRAERRLISPLVLALLFLLISLFALLRGTLLIQPPINLSPAEAQAQNPGNDNLSSPQGVTPDIQANESSVSLNPVPIWMSIRDDAVFDIAWGDVDNDGDLDLAVATQKGPKLYLNDKNVLQVKPDWSASNEEIVFSVAWGDADNDGDIDLAVGGKELKIYVNDQGHLEARPPWVQTDFYSVRTDSVVWGDLDGDGDFDLAAGTVEGAIVHLNRGLDSATGQLQQMTRAWWSTDNSYNTESVALADVDKDGRLDLAVGINQEGQSNQIYRNLGMNADGTLALTPVWTSTEIDSTTSLAWGDVDGDGDFDLAVGNEKHPDKIYLNQGVTAVGNLQMHLAWWSTDEKSGPTFAVAWGDVDDDGDLDLTAGRIRGNKFYLNQGQNQQGNLLMNGIPVSADRDNTLSLAWGDMDGDGDLDLAVGNQENPLKVYLSESTPLEFQSGPVFATDVSISSLAWGDVNNDGYLDMAVGHSSGFGIYVNDKQGGFQNESVWPESWVFCIAWGDVDGDGYLDVAVGTESGPRVYRNIGGHLDSKPLWPFAPNNDEDRTRSVAWGDVDGDGDLDLAVGAMARRDWAGASNKIYRNNGGMLEETPFWNSGEVDITSSIAWGDMDSDGDLDLAVGNFGQPNRVYLNDDGSLPTSATWSSDYGFRTRSVAWGDANRDGNLDLAVGVEENPLKIYLNENGLLQTQPAWLSADSDAKSSIAWGDADSDGDLDLAVGVERDSSKVYLNEGGFLKRSAAWASDDDGYTSAIAWGDIDNDGDLDLAIGNSTVSNGNTGQEYVGGGKIYLNQQRVSRRSAAIVINHVGTQQADLNVPLTYTLFHPDGAPIRKIQAFYSFDGGGHWFSATTDTLTNSTCSQTLLATGPYPTTIQTNTHVFTWDVFNSGFFGQSANTVVRLVAYPSLCPFPGTAPGFYQRAYVSAQTFPFRVRGNQIRVLTAAGPAPNALVYQLPQDGFTAEPIAGGSGQPFHTNNEGYLQGRGVLTEDNKLVALMPYPLTRTTNANTNENDNNANDNIYNNANSNDNQNNNTNDNTDDNDNLNDNDVNNPANNANDRQSSISTANLIPFTDRISFYYTSASPYTDGLRMQPIQSPGLQVLTVSGANPLLLFNLDVSLEWDARQDQDKQFLAQLNSDLRRTSELLFDYTNGQAALGEVKVYHDRDHWDEAHIRIYATNSLRPNATQGGIVTSVYTDPLDANVVYFPGQVRMGVIWNRYGSPEGNLGEDWPRALSHELGHYLFFLDDHYLGLSGENLIPVDSCGDSVMTDPYREDYSEFHRSDESWAKNCQNTLAAQTTHRSDWETVKTFYWLLNSHQNPPDNPGPSSLPLAVTRITFEQPSTSTTVLPVPIFSLRYSSDGHRYLARAGARATLYQRDNHLIDLGIPIGDQVVARGARPGDRLCVYDVAASPLYLGCIQVDRGNTIVKMSAVKDWQPDIIISTLTTNTLTVKVPQSGIGPVECAQLKARLYPLDQAAGESLSFSPADVGCTAAFSLPGPIAGGYIRIWIAGTESESSPKEIITDFALGDSPTYGWGTGGGGGYYQQQYRGYYGYRPRFRYRGRWAPAISPDGQVMLYYQDVNDTGAVYALQAVTVINDLPSWATVVGKAYRLIVSAGAPTENVSINFDYLKSNVPYGEENGLHVYFRPDQPGATWERLTTTVSITYNQASAQTRDEGIYALMSSLKIPLEQGCNLVSYPVDTRPIAEALASIDKGKITRIKICKPDESSTEQVVCNPDSPSNDLSTMTFGQSYLICVSEPVTWYLKGEGPGDTRD